MKPLEHILVDSFGLTQEDVQEAVALQAEKGQAQGKTQGHGVQAQALGEALLQQNKISEPELLQAIGLQCGLEVRTKLPLFPNPPKHTHKHARAHGGCFYLYTCTELIREQQQH